MPKLPLLGYYAPVTHIDSLNDVAIVGNRALLCFDSLGSNVRLSISERTLHILLRQLEKAKVEIVDNRADCNIIAFEKLESDQ